MGDSNLRRRFLAAASCLVLACGSFAGRADPPETAGDPIVVTARKMRTTKIEYAVRGPYLQGCVPHPSVGSPAADRILCKMLQQCLLEGHSGEVRAKACLDDRIRRFAEQDVPIEAAEPSFDAQVKEALAASPAIAPPLSETPGEIAVIGSRHPIPPGLWRFLEYSTYTTSRNRVIPPSTRQWQACMTDDDLHVFASALQAPDTFVNQAPPLGCRSWKIRMKGNDFTGSSSCFLQDGATNQGKLSGHIEAEHIEVTKQVRFVAKPPDARRPVFFAVTQSELSARRIGACTGR